MRVALLRKLKRIALTPFDRGDHAADGQRRVENTDSLAARGGREGGPSSSIPTHGAPPGYVKQDDGRPRH